MRVQNAGCTLRQGWGGADFTCGTGHHSPSHLPCQANLQVSGNTPVSVQNRSEQNQRCSALTYGGRAGLSEPCKCWVPVPINSDFLIKPLGRARWPQAVGPLPRPLDQRDHGFCLKTLYYLSRAILGDPGGQHKAQRIPEFQNLGRSELWNL